MPRSRSLVHVGLGAFAVAGIVLAGASCVAKTPASIACGDENRPTVDCSTEVSYQGYRAESGFGVQNLASGSTGPEQVALRRITEVTERYVTAHSTLCKEYNVCALDQEEYNEASKEIRETLEKVPVLVEQVKTATSDEARIIAIDSLYRHTVPQEERVEEVALRLGMEAELPQDVGGQRITVRPGTPLPTETRAWFWVEATPTAYVYIFQKNARGEVTVLFPDERIGTTNPLAGKTKVRIPNGDLKFRVNDKDIGTEFVYFAASRKPQASLDQALARVREGKTTTIGQDKLLAGFDALPPPGTTLTKRCRGLELDAPPPPDCPPRARGLELDVGGGFGQGASVGAVTEPGDGLIVYSFMFQHTTLAGYAEAGKAQAGKPSKTHGLVVFDEDRPKTRGGLIIDRATKENKDPKTRGGLIIDRADPKPKEPTTRGGLIID